MLASILAVLAAATSTLAFPVENGNVTEFFSDLMSRSTPSGTGTHNGYY